MADLIDRLTFDEDVTGRPKIAVHQFRGCLVLYTLGVMTRQEIVAEWDLQGDEITQAGEVADAIDAAQSADAKHNLVERFDSVALLLDIGSPRYLTGTTINKVAVRSDAGF